MRSLFFLAALLAACTAATAAELTGRASGLDGDTIEIRCERIRLHGIDAPESGQQCQDAKGAPWPCGRESSFALDDFLAASRPTHCTAVDRDRWGRMVATCIRNDGADNNAWLVRQGWALDWPRYSEGAYHGAQEEARINRRGIWRGEFVEPWDWRAGARLYWTVGGEPLDPDCVIKGNINAAASASITCRAGSSTTRPSSTRQLGSAGSAARRKRSMPAGARRGGDAFSRRLARISRRAQRR